MDICPRCVHVIEIEEPAWYGTPNDNIKTPTISRYYCAIDHQICENSCGYEGKCSYEKRKMAKEVKI